MSIMPFIILFFLFLIKSIENNYINDFSLKEDSLDEKSLLNELEQINYNNIDNIFSNKNLYISENKIKYQVINEILNSSRSYRDIMNNTTFAEIPENLTLRYDQKYQFERRFKIIRTLEKKKNNNIYMHQNSNNFNSVKENNNYFNNLNEDEDDYFSDKHNFYGNKTLLNFDYHYYWHFLFSKKAIINNLETSHIKDIIKTDPENITVHQRICFPITELFSIYNPDTEDNLLIKDIKSDLYQVKIFPYLPENYNGAKGEIYSSINSYFPYNIFPQSKFVFQLLILPDIKGEIKGNLYIKFNDKNILIIPITIIGLENEYKVEPIYKMNIQLYKQLSIPIKITNPDNKQILQIKDIIFNFNNNIKIEYPNGIKIMSNISSMDASLLHIKPRDSKNILYLKYFPNKVVNEYGFIFLKINDENNMVIPIIINVENYELNLFPIFINFGVCEVKPNDRKNFIKVVPLLITNYGNHDLEIRKVYIDYNEQFIHFLKISKNEKKNDKIIVIKNSSKKFGYLIFDGEYYITKEKDYYKGKIKIGTIYIETNSTINPMIGIDYFYITDYNNIIQIKSGYVQNAVEDKTRNVFSMVMEYKPSKGFKSDYNANSDKLCIYKDNFNMIKYNKQNKALVYQKDLVINYDSYDKKYHYYPFILNDRLYTIFPFEVNNNNINIALVKAELNNFSLNSCLSDKTICSLYTLKNTVLKIPKSYNLGSITGEISLKVYMYIINNNLYPSYIRQIKTTNDAISVDLENYYSISKDDSRQDYDLSLKGKLPNLIQKIGDIDEIYEDENIYDNSNINLILYPKAAMLLSININTKNENKNKLINGEVHLYINKSAKFILANNIHIFYGDFSISPSNIKFGPGYLGITHSQQIFCTNTYEFPLDIISVTSSDSRLIPTLLTRRVKSGHKTAIIDIVFNPDVNSSIRKYKGQLDMEKSLTFNEYYLWKKSEEYWDELGQKGKTEISADISVVTKYKTKTINVRSFIKRPNLVKKEEIDYGLMQVGHSVEKYIEGHNPTDSVLEMKLILAPDNYINKYDCSMFSLKERTELFLDPNNIMTILSCNFVVKKNNTHHTFFEHVLIKENLNLDNNFTKAMNKEEIFKKIFYYGNENVKKYLYNSINVLCNYEKKTRESIILSKDEINEKFIKNIISSDFNKEIDLVKNMTLNTDYKKKLEKNNYNIFSKLFSKIYHLFSSKEKNNLPNFQIHELKQSFYLQENISQNIYRIQPHQNFTIGPIIFKPLNKGRVSNTLFLKNNLTILYPIKLRGEGGSGQITFLNYLGDSKDKKFESFNNSNYIVEINRETYENKMKYNNSITRTIVINNSGNLPLIIKSISVDGNECQTDDLKIIQCREFLIDVGETIELDFEVTTNFNNAITNRIVKFQSDFQGFELNIIIIISKELCEQNKHFFKLSNIVFVIIMPTLIFIYICRKLIDSNQKKDLSESSIINGGQGHIESAKKLNSLKENENKNKGQKKKGKKKNKNNENDKESNILKHEKTAVNYKSVKTVIKSNDNNKVKSETKTFGVIYINKDKQNINVDKEKNKKEVSIINKPENKNNEKKEEVKEKKIEKIPEKTINESNPISEHKSSISDFEENNENIISYEYNTGKNNKQININNDSLNKNINQLLNSNNNISNNINIKININLTSKSNNTDSEESKEIIQNNNNEKLTEANLSPDSGKNDNNYNYNIKINEKLVKEKNSSKISKNKTTTSKKNQNLKKISNLKELLDDGKPSKKKSSTTKKKSKKIEKEIPKISEDIKEKDEKDEKEEESKIPESPIITEIKEESKIFDDKNNSNDFMKINEDFNNDNNDENDIDFNKFDFFNSDKNGERSEDDEEKEKEDENEDYNLNYNIFNDHVFSLYDNPFCTEEKKGDLDQLLKKNK